MTFLCYLRSRCSSHTVKLSYRIDDRRADRLTRLTITTDKTKKSLQPFHLPKLFISFAHRAVLISKKELIDENVSKLSQLRVETVLI